MKNFLLTAAFILIGELLYAQTNFDQAKENETKKWAWSHSNLGSGLSLNYFFEKDQTYEITFWVKTSSNVSKPNKKVLQSTINIRTASNTSYDKFEYTLPNFTEYSEVVWSQKAGEKFNQWQQKKIYFTPTYNNLQLWLYPLMTANANDNGGARIEMEIDNIVIKKSSDKHFSLSSL
ncbi:MULTISPECIES: hypothetical protein [Flavobacterium]|uniref:CBM-cenC domain-containing protein n=1 Tax=Flavobacterium hankyongi TaxID=1176532 RepID=A0ABP8ZU18_9FLAO|nr:hypothetical protein [Flavobacterium sp. N1846]